MRPPRFQVIVDAALVVLFAAALSAPLVGMWLGMGQLQASEEKRPLAPLPSMPLNFRAWTRVPVAFTAYFNDHFGFRKTLVVDHAAFLVRVLGESTTSEVLVGKQGWLYYAKGRYMDSFRGQESFVPGELDQWVTALRGMRDWLASREIPFYVIIPPDKHTIYPEYLPSSVTLNASATRLDTLIAALREANIDVIDVRDDLRRAKSTGALYHQTDTHWNGDGGYVAYRAILLEVGRRFPRVRPYPRSDFKYWRRRATGDLNSILGLTQGYEENILVLVPKVESAVSHQEGRTVISERNDPQLPRMVMMRDSFGNFLTALLSQNFSRATFLWDNNFNPALMEREKPDLVLFELVERRLADGAPIGPP
jgi:alginate O-acetyltransferase complex protein AlgJ